MDHSSSDIRGISEKYQKSPPVFSTKSNPCGYPTPGPGPVTRHNQHEWDSSAYRSLYHYPPVQYHDAHSHQGQSSPYQYHPPQGYNTDPYAYYLESRAEIGPTAAANYAYSEISNHMRRPFHAEISGESHQNQPNFHKPSENYHYRVPHHTVYRQPHPQPNQRYQPYFPNQRKPIIDPDPAEKVKPKVKKTKKDPRAPKHPMSGFLYYLTEKRKGYGKNYPGVAVGVLSKIIAGEWKELSQEQKSPFLKLSDDDKKRYQREMCTWHKRHQTAADTGLPVTEEP